MEPNEAYALDAPPAVYEMTAPDSLFNRKGGNTIMVPAKNLVFDRTAHVKINGKVQPVVRPEESDHLTKQVALTHAEALGFEHDGFILKPSPKAAELANEHRIMREQEEAAAKVEAGAVTVATPVVGEPEPEVPVLAATTEETPPTPRSRRNG